MKVGKFRRLEDLWIFGRAAVRDSIRSRTTTAALPRAGSARRLARGVAEKVAPRAQQHVIPRSTSFRQHVSEGGAGFLRVGGAVGGLHDLAHEETQQFGLALAVARGLLGMLLRDLAGSVT